MILRMPTAPVSVVSGGSRGLGLAIVEHLLDRGDRVATFSRSGSAELDALAAAHPAELLTARLDAADSDALRGFVADVAARFGRIDHCIANAAIAHEGVLAMMRDDEIDAMLAVNVRGGIIFVRECVRQMLAAGGGDSSAAAAEPASPPAAGSLGAEPSGRQPPPAATRSITVVSSVVAESGSPGLTVYAATKAALDGFARSLARELGPRGIRVNSLAPGFLETDLSASLSDSNRARIASRSALRRLGQAADVVGAIEFLTGPQSAFVTGQTIGVDGGR
jgi:3-oxoacyl-[acyl-carrier protein] reductase